MNLSEQKNSIGLASTVMNTGVELRQLGSKFVGLCPFHADRTPSFYIYPDNRFHCFGCNTGGDVIDFVQKAHGLSFPDALKHLGIEKREMTPAIRRDISRRKRRVELLRQFRDSYRSGGGYCGYLPPRLFISLRTRTFQSDLGIYFK